MSLVRRFDSGMDSPSTRATSLIANLAAMVPYVITEKELVHVLDVMKNWFHKNQIKIKE